MSDEIQYWKPERQPWHGSCAKCRMDPEKQILPGHDACLPPVTGWHTADNVLVTVGLRVWDYNLREGTVTEVGHSIQGTPDGPLGLVAWHLVTGNDGRSVGMFDGSRMCTTHPTTGNRPKNCCPSYTEHMYTECPELALTD